MTTIAIVGERIPDFPPHVATDEAIAHSAEALGVEVLASWVATDEELPEVDAIWCAPGSPYRSLDGALAALRYGRESGVPTLGTCGGCQHMLELSIPDDRSGVRVLPLEPPAQRRLSLAVLHDAEPLPPAMALMNLSQVRSAVRAEHQAL